MKTATFILLSLIALVVIVSACTKQTVQENTVESETTLSENDMTANLVIEEETDLGALDEIEVSESLIE